MKFVKLRYLLTLVATVFAAAGCIDGGLDIPGRDGEGGASDLLKVRISVPEASTRTVIDTDEGGWSEGETLSLRWAEGDTFGLWAVSEGGVTAFADALFTHEYDSHANDPEGVIFFGTIPHVMAKDTYNYYGFYPAPAVENVTETTVSYDIPSTQSGDYDPDLDIMRASVSGQALTQGILNSLNLNFEHKLHALKILIHSNPFEEHGFGINKIRIEFPQPVAGRAEIGIADGSFALSEGRNEITVDFAESKGAGDEFWVFVAPQEQISGAVKFTAYGGADGADNWSSEISSTEAFTRLAEQHITPVTLGLHGAYTITWFDFEIDPSQLGEDIQTLHLSLPDGCTFSDGTTSKELQSDAEGYYSVGFRTDELEKWGSISMTPVFESENALVPEKNNHHEPLMDIVAGNYTPGAHNYRAIKAPYLFFEDFCDFAAMSSDDAYTGGFSTGGKNGKAFNYYSGAATGWSGARSGAQAGTAIRLAARREAIFASASYPARIDSAPLSNLKPGASVSVNLVFDYGANYQGTRVSNTISIGRVENPAIFASNASDGTFESGNSFEINENDGTYNNLPHKDQLFVLNGCVADSRITWIGTATNLNGTSNTTCWLYIDNVRVTIK